MIMWEIRLFEISGDNTIFKINLTKTDAEKSAKTLNKKCSLNEHYQAFETKS